MVVLTLAAFALRLYRLGHASLRGDEAFDVLFASQSLGELLYQFRFVQPYPPLFHTGLHFWLPVAGQSEFAIRFGAVLCATLVVPAVYALGSQLFDTRVGLVGALLAVANPFIHWWGQDAHFYAYLLATTSILNVIALRLWRSEGYPRFTSKEENERYGVLLSGLYILVALLSFLTHYFAYFTWGALNVVAVVETLRRRWSRQLVRRWWTAQVLVVILYLPWLILTIPVTSTYVEPWIQRVPPWEILWRDLVAFNLGYTWPLLLLGPGDDLASAATKWLPGFFAALAIIGVILGWKRTTYRPAVILTLSLILVPLSVIYLTSFHRPIFDEKLTIFLLPLYLVLLSLAIVELTRHWRWVGLLAGLVVLVTMLFANYQYATDERFAKSPAWREMMDYVNKRAQPGDLLVYNFPEPSVLYYNEKKLPVELIPDSAGLSTDEISAHLEQTMAGYKRVWLVPLVRPWWDARGDPITLLDRHADRLDQRFFRGVHVNLYLTPPAWQSAMTPQPVTFAKGIRLLGFRLSGGKDEAHSLMLSPGDTLRLSLYWQADGPTDVPYTIFTHLVGPDGQIYGQWDNPPVWGTYPTTEWSPGENVVDHYEIPVNPDAPPGDYYLLVGLYEPVTGKRLPVLDDEKRMTGDSIQINSTISIQTR
jgi:4-amino-4-deoxy-L-arabinose transferase-like glycosyltransferase